MKKRPERRCIGCRSSDPKSTMLRFVCDGNQVVWDKDQRAPGRGAYVHRREGCWAKMVDVRLWNRAFRLQSGTLDGSTLVALLEVVRPEVHGVREKIGSPRVNKIRL